MWSAKGRGLSRGQCRGGQRMTAKGGRKTMVRGKLSGLMIGALVLVAVGARGYAAETSVKAAAPITGEGRFYKIGDNQLLFMGYFQGNVEVEGQRGDLQGAGMVCPGLMEVDRTTRTQQGEGRCILATVGRRCPLCPLGLHRETGGGVWRALHHHRRHREIRQGLGPEPVRDAQYGGRGGDHGPGKRRDCDLHRASPVGGDEVHGTVTPADEVPPVERAGPCTGGLVMATPGTDEGVWEASRGWGWWMTPGVGHQDVAADDRFARRRSLLSLARKGRV